MTPIREFLTLDSGDQTRLVTASVLLLVVSVGIVTLSFSRVRGLLLRGSSTAGQMIDSAPPPSRIVWAVKLADHKIPGERTCLVRSITAEALLRVYGYCPQHRIGVAKDEEADIKAHSWIEHDGQVLIGDLHDLSRYQPLPSLDGGEDI